MEARATVQKTRADHAANFPFMAHIRAPLASPAAQAARP